MPIPDWYYWLPGKCWSRTNFTSGKPEFNYRTRRLPCFFQSLVISAWSISMRCLAKNRTQACLKSKPASYQLSYTALSLWILHHLTCTLKPATLRPAKLTCTLSYDAPCWPTLHPALDLYELSCTLLSFAAHYWATLHPLSYAASSELRLILTKLHTFLQVFEVPECQTNGHLISPVREWKKREIC
jgi:hypothetical protein